ncbi:MULTISPECIES: ABC transporter substrate-binding protein [Streptomyces]|jgi:simple sugar transport system substrate-binding protein|uniref:ABC transporter substrate-binding protein n=1 Tax=Streptomyces phaeochromogenes TaxID=1923 RepID=A0ABZ1H409_STRPH|nr:MULTISPECIES: ABC transporter substrate-binding protein [Streptomyces phaeochromogenes group]MCR3728090.1 simple sugar transport system substrate-binding protein [Streptomyces umbrinus]MCX4562812.1 ABC transporter substrate-binding protein [Streptomyces phaeochromogenes]MCX5599891.1 ABC transporter substrate-binding protein [Streptomyces phaeochromogenes]WRZ27638.1 ABC transporter substrate-binding protein [Streptomyces phaeochromogenes]WSD13200.1 ABC transporter substrate-binding protein [
MLNRRNFLTAAVGVAAAGGLAACAKEDEGGSSSSDGNGGGKKITLGFAQVGSESGWRTANTKSVKAAAKDAGYTLKFSDAQQKQENQISAIRSYIAQKVNVIAFSPVVVTGWDAVLKEAKTAKIPVILTDRSIETSDDSLYVSFIGSDFTDEGRRAGKMLETVLEKAGHKGAVKIAQLEGTTGAAPALERAKGFKEIMDADHKDDWKIVVSQTGDFTRAGGKQVMAAFLQSNPDINVLYAHNDDMALGAIQSIEAAGKKAGKDILIISVDGVKDGFVAMSEGKINGIVECNPLLGPQLMELVKKVNDGETVERRIKTKEGDFLQEQAKDALPTRKY